MSEVHRSPSVLAVVVSTDGAPTLPRTLEALAAQTHDDLTVVGVDNGSRDATRTLLRTALGEDRVLVADRDLGFGGAVAMALDAEVSRGHELVLLVHDDLALRPDAVARLAEAFEADPQLAVAGCKLVEWDDERQLQAVGMRVDITGRADSGVDDDEVDQGQRDHVDEVLYVSTAGMMVRRDVFDRLGRFDVRYHLFRDDLDLCWRAHLAGHRVEVVTAAVAAHDASASNYRRLGQTAVLGPRYFAERNTLASLLKNYGVPRLLVVLPLFLLVGVAKVLGFVATRRLGDAWQTVRAWAWNLLHLRETRRLRHATQALRTRSDGELAPLFAKVSTRLRAYAEAVGDVLTGGDAAIEPGEPEPGDREVPTLWQQLRRAVRTSPVGVAATLLGVLGIVVSLPLLAGGPLRGGELAPWPEGVGALLGQYVRPWTLSDLPGVVDPSPGLALLELVSVVATGSAWAAPRLLLLGLVPVAWFAALRAGRLVTRRRLPRVAGATLYALSPPVLAALRTGRVTMGLAAVLLPLLVVTASRAFGPGVPRERAWRATALVAVLAAALVAVLPQAALLVVAAAVAVALGSPLVPGLRVVGVVARVTSALLGGALLLLPWVPSITSPPVLVDAAASTSLWRVLLLTPDLPGFVAMASGAGLVAASLLGLALVDEPRRGLVGSMWVLLLVGVGTSWWLVRAGLDAPAWAGGPLLLSALAGAMLLGVAFSAAPNLLGAHAFGWRQVATGATVAVVVVGVAASVLAAGRGTWDGYARDDGALPAFLATEPAAVGPFRVLVLADDGDEVRWQLTDADGPSAATLVVDLPDDTRALVASRLDALLSDADPDAAGLLGPLGVRYVVVPEQGRSDRLEELLTSQLDLTAQPVAEGVVHRVGTWLPRWTLLDAADAEVLAATGRPPADLVPEPVEPGDETGGGVLVHADAGGGDEWLVRVDGEVLEAEELGDVRGWELPAGSTPEFVPRRSWRPLLLGGQLALWLLALSLTLRAPRFARRPQRRPRRSEQVEDAEGRPTAPTGGAR